MATHDYVIDNSTGANVRSDLNNVLQAILTNNSSSSAPSTTAAYMWWADTTNGVLKIRNSANDGWVELFQLDGTITLEDGTASTPALSFRDDLNTGVYSSAADTFNVATAGVERMELGATTIFNEDGADVDFRIEGDTNANLFTLDAGDSTIGINISPVANRAPLHVHRVSSSDCHVHLTNTDTGTTQNDGLSLFVDSIHGGVWLREDAPLLFATNDSERYRVTNAGALLINKTTDRNAYYGGTLTGNLQVEGTGNLSRLTQFIHNTNDAGGHIVVIGKSRGTSVGSYTVVQSSDYLGTLSFQGADGDAMIEGARIDAIVDGTPSDQDMPARLSFGVTADGASSTTERMRINNDGTVAIGPNTDGHALLTLSQSASAHLDALAIQQGNTGSGSGDGLFIGIDSNADAFIFHKENRSIEFGTANTERLRIDSEGRVGIGSSSPAERLIVVTTANTMVPLAVNDSSNTATPTHRISLRTGGTEVGSIKATNSATTFNTSSDYRLKENAVAISDGITRLKTLKPYRFNFKNNPNKTLDGFFAHEVTAVPEAVDGGKDEVATQDHLDMGLAKEIGDPIYQSIDHSKLVPLLTSSLQEAIAKIETLETKVAALEAA